MLTCYTTGISNGYYHVILKHVLASYSAMFYWLYSNDSNDVFVTCYVEQANKVRTFGTRVYCVGVKDFKEHQVHSPDVNIVSIVHLDIVYFIFILFVIVCHVYLCIWFIYYGCLLVLSDLIVVRVVYICVCSSYRSSFIYVSKV